VALSVPFGVAKRPPTVAKRPVLVSRKPPVHQMPVLFSDSNPVSRGLEGCVSVRDVEVWVDRRWSRAGRRRRQSHLAKQNRLYRRLVDLSRAGTA
jgi:hypothetical protein